MTLDQAINQATTGHTFPVLMLKGTASQICEQLEKLISYHGSMTIMEYWQHVRRN